MNRLTRYTAAAVWISFALFVRAEALQTDEAGFPAFAVARLSIAKTGVFLDQNGAFANRISPNVGPLAKVALANILFKLPIDESLNFEGPAQIYVLPPLTYGANQETATILPVSDAEKLKKNLISIFGEPMDQNGALAFTVPQPLPLPDKTMLLKIVGNKALLASNDAALKQL